MEETRAKYIKEGRYFLDDVIEIDNERIIPLFDAPHLLKGMRNTPLKHNITFQQDNCLKTAIWSDIKNAWLNDGREGDLSLLNKITEAHVDESKVKKMKVSIAAQTFSKTVAAVINIMAGNGTVWCKLLYFFLSALWQLCTLMLD